MLKPFCNQFSSLKFLTQIFSFSTIFMYSFGILFLVECVQKLAFPLCLKCRKKSQLFFLFFSPFPSENSIYRMNRVKKISFFIPQGPFSWVKHHSYWCELYQFFVYEISCRQFYIQVIYIFSSQETKGQDFRGTKWSQKNICICSQTCPQGKWVWLICVCAFNKCRGAIGKGK